MKHLCFLKEIFILQHHFAFDPALYNFWKDRSAADQKLILVRNHFAETTHSPLWALWPQSRAVVPPQTSPAVFTGEGSSAAHLTLRGYWMLTLGARHHVN